MFMSLRLLLFCGTAAFAHAARDSERHGSRDSAQNPWSPDKVDALRSLRLGLLSGSLEHRKSFSIHVNQLFAYEFTKRVADSRGVPGGVQYALVSCGSMGRLEMAPLSDIDYFVLVSNNDAEVKDFFLGIAKGMREVFKPLQGYRLPICPFTAPDRYPQLIGTPEYVASLQRDSNLEGHVVSALADPYVAFGDEGLLGNFVANWFHVAKGDGHGPGINLALDLLQGNHHLNIDFVDTKAFIKAIEMPVVGMFLCRLFRETTLPSPLAVHIMDRLKWLVDHGAMLQDMADALANAYHFFFALRVQVHNTVDYEQNFVQPMDLDDKARVLLPKLRLMISCFNLEARNASIEQLSSTCLQTLDGSTITRAPVINFSQAEDPAWAPLHGTVVNTGVDGG